MLAGPLSKLPVHSTIVGQIEPIHMLAAFIGMQLQDIAFIQHNGEFVCTLNSDQPTETSSDFVHSDISTTTKFRNGVLGQDHLSRYGFEPSEGTVLVFLRKKSTSTVVRIVL
jgi:hypothetical protein